MNDCKRIIPFLLPLSLLALLSGVVPVISGAAQTLSREGLASLEMLFQDRAILYAAKISTVWAFATTFGVLLLAFPIAVSIYVRPRLFPVAMVILAVPWIVPVFISAPIWRLFFHGINGESLFNTITGLRVNLLTQPVGSFLTVLFTSVLRSTPPAVFILYAVFRTVPRTIVEAARIDGATEWQTTRFIFVPQAHEILLVLIVVGLVEGFGEFTLPFLMTAGGPPLIDGITAGYVVGATTTIEIYLYDLFQFSGSFVLPVAYATVTLLVFLCLAATWLVVRRRDSAFLFFIALTSVAVLVFDRSIVGFITILSLGAALLFKSARYWIISAASGAYLLYTAILTIRLGVLQGFQPAVVPLVFLIAQCRYGIATSRRVVRDRIGSSRAGARRVANALWAVGRTSAWLIAAVAAGTFLYLLLWVSFSGVNSVFVDSVIPPFFGLRNYGELFSDRGFLVALFNTMRLAGLTAVATVGVAFPAAAAIALLTTSGRKVFLGLQFLRLSGGIHSLIPLFTVFVVVRLIDTHVPLVLLYAFQAAPIAFIVIHSFVRELPSSLFDTARIAGAGTGQYFRRILFPICGPAVINAALISFLTAWNGFLIPLIFLTDQRKFPISMYLHNTVGTIASGAPAWGLFAAGSVVNVVLLAVLFLLVRRPFQTTAAAHLT